MSAEGHPQGRTFLSAEQERTMREDAARRARARIAAQQQAQSAPAPAPAPERRRPTPSVKPLPPSHAPTTGQQPVRRTTRSAPVSPGEAPRTSGTSLLQPELQTSRQVAEVPSLQAPEARPRRRGRKAFAYLALAGVLTGGGKVAWDHNVGNINEKVPNINLPSAPQAGAESVYGEIVAPAVTGAEGFNMQNCTRPGSEIASLRITTGHYAMRYLLQLGEDPAPRVQPPYLTEENMKGEGKEGFDTDSGYPEMTVHDIVMQIYACQKDGTSAVDTSKDGVIVNKNNLDFVAKPLLPEPNTGVLQTEAYMSDLDDGVIFTYPRDWLPVVDSENTDALKAAREVHSTEAQQLGVFNIALQTAVAGASTASESDFFKEVDFMGSKERTLYSAIDEGLKQRLGSENVMLTGAVNSITAQDPSPDAKATLIDTTGDPADTFKIVEGEVIVGHYATEQEQDKE